MHIGIYSSTDAPDWQAKSLFEWALTDHGQRLIRAAEAAMVIRVSATSVSCS